MVNLGISSRLAFLDMSVVSGSLLQGTENDFSQSICALFWSVTGVGLSESSFSGAVEFVSSLTSVTCPV